MGLIYRITSPDGKCYIGQTIRTFEKRVLEHKNRNSKCTVISRAISKYGPDKMSFEIVEDDIPLEKLDEKEMFYIIMFNSLTPNGYNLTGGGQAGRFSDEGRELVKNGIHKANINKKGFIGSIIHINNKYYPVDTKKQCLSIGGFYEKKDAEDVLFAYTEDPGNYVKVMSKDHRSLMEIKGCVWWNGRLWIAEYKVNNIKTNIGSFQTEEEARVYLANHKRDPLNYPIIKKPLLKGGVIQDGNKYVARVRARQIGRFDSKEEAEIFMREYISALSKHPSTISQGL